MLLGVPYDASSSFLRGAARGPALIREALYSPAGNSWSESLVDIAGPDGLRDGGDLVLANEVSATSATSATGGASGSTSADTAGDREVIEQGVARVLATPARPITLGGDHSISYPILRAINRVYPRPTILHIDAHPDLYEDFEGDRFSHACPMARILEEGLASRLVQVGIRTMSQHQREQADRYGVEVIDMRAWAAGARPTLEGPVYLSIDIDGIDPAFAPGVSHREPGGLTVRDVIGLIQGIVGPIVGADIVEYNPVHDQAGVTAIVAAKLVKELASRMIERK